MNSFNIMTWQSYNSEYKQATSDTNMDKDKS